MLSNIFFKSLYERRWSTLVWFSVTALMSFLIMLMFPSLKESLGKTLQDVPESMQSFLGDAATYQTIPGFVDLQVIAQMVFFTIIMAVLVGTALISGDEHKGTLQTLLAQPVKRGSAYFQKLFAMLLMVAVVCAGIFVGVYAGVLAIGETINTASLLNATFMTWVVTIFFGCMAYGLGAATGKRSIAGVLTGFYAFLAYMLTALAGLAPSLEKLNNGSPFYYFNNPSVIKDGLDGGNIAVLLTGCLLFIVIGYISFRKRDISA